MNVFDHDGWGASIIIFLFGYPEDAIATYRNASLIYNPCAGKLRGGRAGLVSRVVEALATGGHRVAPVPTPGPRTAGAIARERIAAGADLVLALGGDGTMNEVLQGMVHAPAPFAMIPAGTANVLTRELGLGCEPLRVARGVAEWAPRRVAVGLLRCEPGPLERYFMLMAGVGFDAHIVYNLSLPAKARYGQLAYWLGAVKELGRKLEQVEVQAAGQTHTCAFAIASRVRNYAGYLQIADRASMLRNDFEIGLFRAASAFSLYARYLAPVVLRRASHSRSVLFLRAPHAGFSALPGTRVYVQVDGEYAGRLPASVEIVTDAVTLLVPPAFPG